MRSWLTIAFLFSMTAGFSQGSFSYYDSLTYALYEQGLYSDVVRYGNEALDAGFDYYYLRMRIGIAHYSLKQYNRAARHFVRAFEASSDQSSAEYLYYSLLFSNRAEEAREFLCRNQELLSQIPAPCGKAIAGLYSEGGYKQSSGDVRSIGDIRFFHGGIRHLPGSRWEIYQGYSRIRQQFYSFEYVSGPGPGPGGTRDSVERRNDISLVQNEYYIRVAHHLGKGWVVSPAFHYQAVSTLDNNSAISVRLEKPVDRMRWQASAAFSEINGKEQQLYTLGMILYPFGNNNLYTEAIVNSHIQDGKSNWVNTVRGGIRIFDGFWVEGLYGWGNMFNYPDMHAFYLYNIPDVIKARMNISALVRIDGRHMLRSGYLYEKKESIEFNTLYYHRGFYVSLTLDLP